ncbi:MAG: ABC transporter transmembrane domain-containing protein [Marinibacterium sp.]|nr:ABC transporter transmembrane domain-containing protein [Marinibacterium sp.]
MFELYAAIWRVSWRRQIVLIILSIAIAALAAVPLNFQQDIINALTQKDVSPEHLTEMAAGMFAVILLSLSLKWLLGYRSGVLGEDVIRILRRRIFLSGGTAPDSSATISKGKLTTMVSAEAEELGKFTGSAFSEPVVQFGTLVSVVGFIAATQPRLGMIAAGIILPQVILVLATQIRVNRYVAARVRILRQASDDMVSAQVQALSDDIQAQFDDIYETRRKMFLWKLSTKFVLSALNGAGTVAVLLLGGYFVLEGRTDVGTVVAATIGLGRLQAPTAFLIAFYRQVSATRVKYELLRDIVLPGQAAPPKAGARPS